jgi:hypothetical protein
MANDPNLINLSTCPGCRARYAYSSWAPEQSDDTRWRVKICEECMAPMAKWQGPELRSYRFVSDPLFLPKRNPGAAAGPSADQPN